MGRYRIGKWLPVVCTGFLLGSAAAKEQDVVSVELGQRVTVLGDREQGLRYFPDGRLGIIERTPEWRVLITAGSKTVLLRGKDIFNLQAAGTVLSPGEAGTFDNGYAGVNAVYRTGAKELLAFYHAEDHEGMPRIRANNVQGFYCSIGLAVSSDEGASFGKVGPIITDSHGKDPDGHTDQGVGEPCVTLDRSEKFLLMYYTSHSRIDRRGVQICLARCPINEAGKATAWKKFHEGKFMESGLGGRDTPVLSWKSIGADAVFPHVTYCANLGKYVMVYCLNAYQEFKSSPVRSGIYVAFSDDGITWPEREHRQLLTGYVVPRVGQEVMWHPTLVLDKDSAAGWLHYSYSESWGHKAPHKAHYWVAAPIEFQRLENAFQPVEKH